MYPVSTAVQCNDRVFPKALIHCGPPQIAHPRLAVSVDATAEAAATTAATTTWATASVTASTASAKTTAAAAAAAGRQPYTNTRDEGNGLPVLCPSEHHAGQSQ